MTGHPPLTAEQDRLLVRCTEVYGDSTARRDEDGYLTITGMDEGGDVRARFKFTARGTLLGAWDPDRLWPVGGGAA